MRAAPFAWRAPVLAAAAVAAALDIRADAGDIAFFVGAADVLLSADWAATFASPDVQSGPLQLLLLGVVDGTRARSASPGLIASVRARLSPARDVPIQAR